MVKKSRRRLKCGKHLLILFFFFGLIYSMYHYSLSYLRSKITPPRTLRGILAAFWKAASPRFGLEAAVCLSIHADVVAAFYFV